MGTSRRGSRRWRRNLEYDNVSSEELELARVELEELQLSLGNMLRQQYRMLWLKKWRKKFKIFSLTYSKEESKKFYL